MEDEPRNDEVPASKGNPNGWHILWRAFLYFAAPVLILVVLKRIFGW